MRSVLKLAAVSLLTFASCDVAFGQINIVTRCGAAAGRGYFLEGGGITSKDSGWQNESISKGQTLLVLTGPNSYDIVFTDATGRTISSREDGATIIVIGAVADRLTLLVNYPEMNVETLMFVLDTAGKGSVTFSQARYGEAAPFRKHSLLYAQCRR